MSNFMLLTRRSFCRAILGSPLLARYSAAASQAAPLKVTAVETAYWNSRQDAPFWPHWVWVKIMTDAGVFGIGETYPQNSDDAAAIHRIAASLIGKDPRDIERIWADLYRSFDFNVAGERRCVR